MTPSLTWEAFERLPDGDGMHREILEGELQVLPLATSGQSQIASNCFGALLPLKVKGIGRVYLEAGYKLSENPPTWIQPDASFLGLERARGTAGGDYFTGGPDLAVEIVSPSESARDLEHKVRLLLAAGSHAVWVIYPESQSVRVHLPDGTSFTRGVRDSLSAPQLLQSWEFPVAQLFED
jgi:Uma2 family endonuclease